MRKLSKGYSSEVDSLDKDSWFEIINKFDDANIYQTWSYDAVRCGRHNISHLTLRKNGAIVAATQARIVKIPLIKIGIAYIRWGPLWKLRKEENRIEHFCQILRALRIEYTEKRRLFLRILPNQIEKDEHNFAAIFKDEHFIRKTSNNKTFLLNITPSIDIIRKKLGKTWRKQLSKAERNRLKVIEGTNDNLFEIVEQLYKEMLCRKKFIPGINVTEFRKIQNDLPNELKMKIMICEYQNKPAAALVGSTIGNTAIELIASTGKEGLGCGASYLLRWKMLERFKECGCKQYDLNSINPVKNPGGYQFKAGLCGKNGKEVTYLGHFDAYKNPLIPFSVKCGEILLSYYRTKWLNRMSILKLRGGAIQCGLIIKK